MVFTDKLHALMVMQLEASEMQIPFCCTSKGRLNTDGKSMFSGCDFCLIVRAAKKPKRMFGPRIVTAFPSTYSLELPGISVLTVDNRQSVLPMSQVSGNLGIDNPDKKQESIKP